MSKECSKKIQVTEYDNTNSNSQTETFDVFISYRRKTGRDIARLLQQTLRNRGYKVFFDYDSLRDDVFDQRIENAIKSAKVLILVMTQGILDTCMNENDWIRKEIDLAKKYGVKIVPIAPTDKEWFFPQEMPWPDLKYLQVSVLDIGSLFDASIDKILQDRFPPVTHKKKCQQNNSDNIQGKILSKSFTLGLSCYTKLILSAHDKQQERRADETLREIMSKLNIPLSKCFLQEYFSNDYYEHSATILPDQMAISLNLITNELDKLYGELTSDIFSLGFRFIPWIIKDELRHDISEKMKMIALMQKIALPEHLINKVVSVNARNGALCRDSLINYFKHHLEHVKECPNCFSRIADDYSQCPVCKTILKKRKMIFSFFEAIKSLFR